MRVPSLGERPRRVLRHVAVGGLAVGAGVTGRTSKGLQRPRVHLVYTHSLPVRFERQFDRLLGKLKEHHDLVGYSEAVRRLREGRFARPTVAFSFDDGFASNVRAAEILERHGATGCFFVCTGLVGLTDPDDVRRFFRMPKATLQSAMTWSDLDRLRSSGHEIGGHTVSHRDLASLTTDEIDFEIGASFSTLQRHLGDVKHFAWPYGRFDNFTPSAARATFDAGYETCASAERGAHIEQAGMVPHRLCLRRDHLMPQWGSRQSMYFIGASARASTAEMNGWPPGWDSEN